MAALGPICCCPEGPIKKSFEAMEGNGRYHSSRAPSLLQSQRPVHKCMGSGATSLTALWFCKQPGEKLSQRHLPCCTAATVRKCKETVYSSDSQPVVCGPLAGGPNARPKIYLILREKYANR